MVGPSAKNSLMNAALNAERVYHDMMELSKRYPAVHPDELTYASLISVWARAGFPEGAEYFRRAHEKQRNEAYTAVLLRPDRGLAGAAARNAGVCSASVGVSPLWGETERRRGRKQRKIMVLATLPALSLSLSLPLCQLRRRRGDGPLPRGERP